MHTHLTPPQHAQVRSLGETVRLDARTKLLNPKWCVLPGCLPVPPACLGDCSTKMWPATTISAKADCTAAAAARPVCRYEGMLSSGYEGVREIQKRLTNTVGWSATSGMVDNWVYDEVGGRAGGRRAAGRRAFFFWGC